MKLCNHAEWLIAIEKSVYYFIGLNNVFVSALIGIFDCKSIIRVLYEADGLRCRTIQSLDRSHVSGRG